MKSLIEIFMLMISTNLLVWFGTNSQFFIKNFKISFGICLILGILSSMTSFFMTRIGYGKFSMWELRMIAFASSYVTFPILTWKFFGESVFEPKTMVSILISVVLFAIQLFWK